MELEIKTSEHIGLETISSEDGGLFIYDDINPEKKWVNDIMYDGELKRMALKGINEVRK